MNLPAAPYDGDGKLSLSVIDTDPDVDPRSDRGEEVLTW